MKANDVALFALGLMLVWVFLLSGLLTVAMGIDIPTFVVPATIAFAAVLFLLIGALRKKKALVASVIICLLLFTAALRLPASLLLFESAFVFFPIAVFWLASQVSKVGAQRIKELCVFLWTLNMIFGLVQFVNGVSDHTRPDNVDRIVGLLYNDRGANYLGVAVIGFSLVVLIVTRARYFRVGLMLYSSFFMAVVSDGKFAVLWGLIAFIAVVSFSRLPSQSKNFFFSLIPVFFLIAVLSTQGKFSGASQNPLAAATQVLNITAPYESKISFKDGEEISRKDDETVQLRVLVSSQATLLVAQEKIPILGDALFISPETAKLPGFGATAAADGSSTFNGLLNTFGVAGAVLYLALFLWVYFLGVRKSSLGLRSSVLLATVPALLFLNAWEYEEFSLTISIISLVASRADDGLRRPQTE